MLDGPLVFVDIDTQRDFLDPSGALYVPGSGEILENLARLTRFATERAIPVLATACAHAEGDSELERFPPHCMIGTDGQARVPATRPGQTVLLDEAMAPPEPIPPHLTLLKREIDFFTHPRADALIERYRRQRPWFVVYGVATDYCVGAAVEGLLERGCSVAIVVDAIRAIEPRDEPELLSDFVRRGAILTITDVVCGPERGPTEV